MNETYTDRRSYNEALHITGCIAVHDASGRMYRRKVDLSNVTESTIGVNGDGSVEEVVIESFDKEYYSLSDLTAYVNKQVDAFNQANPRAAEG